MAKRERKPPQPPDPLKAPPLAACDAICRRFLKPDQAIHWAREMPTFYRLWKRYPNRQFWETFELPFKLNMMSWFERDKGPEELERAWVLFNYNPPALDKVPQVGQDTGSEQSPQAVPPPPVLPPSRPRTVAEMLRGG